MRSERTVSDALSGPLISWLHFSVVAFRLLYKVGSLKSRPSVLSLLFNFSVSIFTLASVSSIFFESGCIIYFFQISADDHKVVSDGIQFTCELRNIVAH